MRAVGRLLGSVLLRVSLRRADCKLPTEVTGPFELLVFCEDVGSQCMYLQADQTVDLDVVGLENLFRIIISISFGKVSG